MALYYVHGRSSDTIEANDVLAQLWNPSSARRIRVVEAYVWAEVLQAATAPRFTLVRSSARGATPFLTVTPDADNSSEADAAPSSATVLELGDFATLPTLASPELEVISVTFAGIASGQGGVLPLPRGIFVAPGSGLCIRSTGGGDVAAFTAGFTFED